MSNWEPTQDKMTLLQCPLSYIEQRSDKIKNNKLNTKLKTYESKNETTIEKSNKM